MKKLLLILSTSSFLLSHTVYFSMDFQNHYEWHSDFYDIDRDMSYENGSILLGYNHKVYQLDQFSLDVGLSFSIQSSDDEDLNDEYDTKTDFYTLYVRPTFTLTNKLSLWAMLGEASGRTDMYRLKTGLCYGTGITMMTTDHISLGLGYSVYNAETKADFPSGIYNLKVKKLSVDLGYTF